MGLLGGAQRSVGSIVGCLARRLPGGVLALDLHRRPGGKLRTPAPRTRNLGVRAAPSGHQRPRIDPRDRGLPRLHIAARCGGRSQRLPFPKRARRACGWPRVASVRWFSGGASGTSWCSPRNAARPPWACRFAMRSRTNGSRPVRTLRPRLLAVGHRPFVHPGAGFRCPKLRRSCRSWPSRSMQSGQSRRYCPRRA